MVERGRASLTCAKIGENQASTTLHVSSNCWGGDPAGRAAVNDIQWQLLHVHYTKRSRQACLNGVDNLPIHSRLSATIAGAHALTILVHRIDILPPVHPDPCPRRSRPMSYFNRSTLVCHHAGFVRPCGHGTEASAPSKFSVRVHPHVPRLLWLPPSLPFYWPRKPRTVAEAVRAQQNVTPRPPRA